MSIINIKKLLNPYRDYPQPIQDAIKNKTKKSINKAFNFINSEEKHKQLDYLELLLRKAIYKKNTLNEPNYLKEFFKDDERFNILFPRKINKTPTNTNISLDNSLKELLDLSISYSVFNEDNRNIVIEQLIENPSEYICRKLLYLDLFGIKELQKEKFNSVTLNRKTGASELSTQDLLGSLDKEIQIISSFIDFKNKAEKYKEKKSLDLKHKQQLDNCIKIVLEQGKSFYNKRKNHNINLMITPSSTKRKKEKIKIIEAELSSYEKINSQKIILKP